MNTRPHHMGRDSSQFHVGRGFPGLRSAKREGGSPGYVIALLTVALSTACTLPKTDLTRYVEAQRLAGRLHVHFARAVDQSSQAVLADTDEAASAAAHDAEQATATAARELDELRQLLDSGGFIPEAALLKQFNDAFTQYRQLESEILSLAVENTNSQALRLAFGPAREAAQNFQRILDPIAHARGNQGCCLSAAASRAQAAVFEILAIEPRHVSEADDDAMTAMEKEMRAAETAARSALAELQAGRVPNTTIDDAQRALDQLLSTNQEVMKLSRRNSDVRSTALSLGRKRTLAAQCDDLLQQLEEALARHEFTGTR